MSEKPVTPARFSENYDYIIDSDGRRVELTDPRVVHISVTDNSPYTKRITQALYEKAGRKYRTCGPTDVEVMNYAKKLCSGRECVPFLAISGHALYDILNNRSEDEISFYFSLNQEGPCQNGGWPAIWETFVKRLNIKNILFPANAAAMPPVTAMGPDHMVGTLIGTVVGHFLEEAKNALTVVAEEQDLALEKFEAETGLLIECVKDGQEAFDAALENWAVKIAGISCRATVRETPKVLIFGGLNLLFVHYPVRDYFIEQGVIPKVVDLTEGAAFLRSENILRYGLAKGFVTPKEQFECLARAENKAETLPARASKMGIAVMESFMEKYRQIMSKSGLMFDTHIKFIDLVQAGHSYVSYNGFTETPVTTGRYVCSVEDGLYDGLINLGSFSCQPAMSSQAIIRPMANANDVPYAAIDVEGPWISTNQSRLLETIAVQAKRRRAMKNRLQPHQGRNLHGVEG